MGVVYWTWVAQGRQEIDIDFAWKRTEVLLVERKSNWGEKRKIGNGGMHLAGSCVQMSIKGRGAELRVWVVILMDSSINRDLGGY